MTDNPLFQVESAVEQRTLIRCETGELLRYLAEELDKQLKFADHELTQTQGLLKDAVETLTACFTGIHDNIRMLQSQGDEAEPRELKPDRCDISRVEPLLNAAIRTLQFQDLTQQLIDHALHRVCAMREVMNAIKSVSPDAACGPMRFIEDIDRCRASIEHNIANLDEHKTNPVSQGHMVTGEIELF